jgi:hypothetical protein
MESNDIVTRLREAGECPTLLRAYLARAVVLRAADEIERLRADVMCLKHQNAEFVRNLTMAQDERNTAVDERDEARREVSYLRPSVCLGAQTANEYARERGWDCFKEER